MTDPGPLQGDRVPKNFRPNAGLAVFSGKGLVFVGRRAGSRGAYQWQMPQGGIDKGETPLEAAYRELEEETGIMAHSVELLEEMDAWLFYDFPSELKSRMSGPFNGQRQKWFAFRLTGPESDVDLERHEPEFDAWRWISLEETPGLVIPFKRPVYEHVVSQFTRWTK